MTDPKIEGTSISSQTVHCHIFIHACTVLGEFLKLSYDSRPHPPCWGKLNSDGNSLPLSICDSKMSSGALQFCE